jgi:hypothetical protein
MSYSPTTTIAFGIYHFSGEEWVKTAHFIASGEEPMSTTSAMH